MNGSVHAANENTWAKSRKFNCICCVTKWLLSSSSYAIPNILFNANMSMYS